MVCLQHTVPTGYMCGCFLFILLFLLADNTDIDLNNIYTSLQILYSKVDKILEQTIPTQHARIAVTSPLHVQTVQPTTEPLHLAGYFKPPLSQATRTNLVPCLQTNPTLQLRTNPTPQFQTNPTPQFQTNPTLQFQTNPTPQLRTNPTPQFQTNPTPQLHANSIPLLIKTP